MNLNRKLIKDAITTGSLIGDGKGGRLNPEQSKKFISYMTDNTAFLKDIRMEQMNAPEKLLDFLLIGSRLIRRAAEGLAPTELAEVETRQKELRSVKVRLAADITTEFGEDNIEGAAAKDNIARQLATQFGNDLADLALNGDAAATGITDAAFLSIGDGFIKQAKASEDTHKVDIAGVTDYKEVFKAMLDSMPNKFKRNKADLRFYVSTQVADDYIDQLTLRHTQLGDSILVNGTLVKYKGVTIFPIEYIPDDVMFLTQRLNFATGVQREMKVYSKFNERKDLTEYTMYFRADPGKIIWDDALVVGYKITDRQPPEPAPVKVEVTNIGEFPVAGGQ
ncbi:MAG: hypothetical protein LBL73_09755 [Synergistaceae bacterium]|jgi:hypothetical protein|nr:hypothetical protein [Synergistaceae bacterium]